MTKEFIPYKQALELKELGFDEPCFTYYFEDTREIRTGLSFHSSFVIFTQTYTMPIEPIVEIATGIVEIGAEASAGEGKRGCGCFLISLIVAALIVIGYLYFTQ